MSNYLLNNILLITIGINNHSSLQRQYLTSAIKVKKKKLKLNNENSPCTSYHKTSSLKIPYI